jgi:hypothetical protein
MRLCGQGTIQWADSRTDAPMNTIAPMTHHACPKPVFAVWLCCFLCWQQRPGAEGFLPTHPYCVWLFVVGTHFHQIPGFCIHPSVAASCLLAWPCVS